MLKKWLVLLMLCFGVTLPVAAEEPATAVISIIIDDLGYRYRDSLRAVHLPGPVTLSFLPHTPYTVPLAKQGWILNKEIMVHLPMQAINGNRLGPGGLTLDMDQQQFNLTLKQSVAAVPRATGINNHMGSLLTRNPTAMQWLMSGLSQQNALYFVDSRTTEQSQALIQAREHGIQHTGRDIFLDHNPDKQAIVAQFTKLIRHAKRHGSALAIGHPRQNTLDVLEAGLPLLAEHGIKLVPVSELIRYRSQRSLAWQTSSSPLPRAAKN